MIPTVNVHVNESDTGTRFVHVRVYSNFSIHTVNEYEAGFSTYCTYSGAHSQILARGLPPPSSLSKSHIYVISNVQYL
jgi:hypothetical protein